MKLLYFKRYSLVPFYYCFIALTRAKYISDGWRPWKWGIACKALKARPCRYGRGWDKWITYFALTGLAPITLCFDGLHPSRTSFALSERPEMQEIMPCKLSTAPIRHKKTLISWFIVWNLCSSLARVKKRVTLIQKNVLKALREIFNKDCFKAHLIIPLMK